MNSNSCLNKCPQGLHADNFSKSCKYLHEQPIYIKAFTISKCHNRCGTVFNDCSCAYECQQGGNCCSDFEICNDVFKFNKCTQQNCQSCPDNEKCIQCIDGFYLNEDSCLKACPESTRPNRNNICIKDEYCSIENCQKCSIKSYCGVCQDGFYLFNNDKCVEKCPVRTVADNESRRCVTLENIQDAYYWTFPSSRSCRDQCGNNYNSQAQDCSCSYHCLRTGNCCDDFDKHCLDERSNSACANCDNCHKGICLLCKANSKLFKNECVCDNGYVYDQITDQCDNINSSGKKNNLASEYPEFDLQSIKKLFENLFSSSQQKNQVIDDSFMNFLNDKQNSSHVYINGNITMNVYDRNENPIIKHENIENKNSFNNDSSSQINRNAQNVVIDPNRSTDIPNTIKKTSTKIPIVTKKNDFESEINRENKFIIDKTDKDNSNLNQINLQNKLISENNEEISTKKNKNNNDKIQDKKSNSNLKDNSLKMKEPNLKNSSEYMINTFDFNNLNSTIKNQLLEEDDNESEWYSKKSLDNNLKNSNHNKWIHGDEENKNYNDFKFVK